MIKRIRENQALSKIGALQSALDRYYGLQKNYSRSQLDHAASVSGFPQSQMEVVYASYMDRAAYQRYLAQPEERELILPTWLQQTA